MSELKELIRIRGTVKAQLTRLINFINNDTDPEMEVLELQKDHLHSFFAKFGEIQTKIEVLDIRGDHDKERELFESQYYKGLNALSKRVKTLKLSESVNQSSSLPPNRSQIANHNNYKPSPLPKNLHFDGKLQEWHSFYDTFKTLSQENNEFSAVQKFNLLKHSLKGEVASKIDSLIASEENYQVAWDLLQKRCNKPRIIVQWHINALLDLPHIDTESPSKLRKLTGKSLMHINALKALNQPTDDWSAMFVTIICNRLDKFTRRAWEHTLERETKCQLWKIYSNF